MENIVVTALDWAPPFAQGIVRDLRVRWALEETGWPYEVELVDAATRRTPEYRTRQPFGQVPVFAVDGLETFESGAIVQLIAERSEALMPADSADRAETLTWIYAALNTVEPPVLNLFAIDVVSPGEEWARLRRPAAAEAVDTRLGALSDRLFDRDYLTGTFSAADILMATVLRFLRESNAVEAHPLVAAYLQRCEARPAFRRALDGQMAVFAANEPVAA
jgi:glutathione S-transferase